jgi:hypothetical protein
LLAIAAPAGLSPAVLTAGIEPYLPIVRVLVVLRGAACVSR